LRTIISIGQPKTGTTSLQHFVQQQREPLSRQGLYVPDVLAGCDNPSHYLLNVHALDPHRSSPMKEHLLATQPECFFTGLQRDLEMDIRRHYRRARSMGCEDMVWMNEGLYLLDSVEEYLRLRRLFAFQSSSIVAVCCFREVAAFYDSWGAHMARQKEPISNDRSSYRYFKPDSWLFDYQRKIRLLEQVFDEVVTFPYDSADNTTAFLREIGYSPEETPTLRLNTTPCCLEGLRA
jgi:hypothetical protein